MMLRHPLRVATIVTVLVAGAGCGIKGPLYLPTQPAPGSAPAAAPVPAPNPGAADASRTGSAPATSTAPAVRLP